MFVDFKAFVHISPTSLFSISVVVAAMQCPELKNRIEDL